MIEIRNEQSGDQDDVRRVNLAAFENGPEAAVVDKLRQSGTSYHSFVAVEQGEIVGHILFTPVGLDGQQIVGAGLAPVAVSPGCQRQRGRLRSCSTWPGAYAFGWLSVCRRSGACCVLSAVWL